MRSQTDSALCIQRRRSSCPRARHGLCFQLGVRIGEFHSYNCFLVQPRSPGQPPFFHRV
ncbi:unnamed protein product [Linum tenue]|uniref:Uncharacterized protein n=1 Tax=Linum tenue TaxID=586396 RepID=A0AAV0K859_9ROSI|nr:unnamed protein product [Linum tenue]